LLLIQFFGKVIREKDKNMTSLYYQHFSRHIKTDGDKFPAQKKIGGAFFEPCG
jgi:hypothetical protein